jgi:hypothetical protein
MRPSVRVLEFRLSATTPDDAVEVLPVLLRGVSVSMCMW